MQTLRLETTRMGRYLIVITILLNPLYCSVVSSSQSSIEDLVLNYSFGTKDEKMSALKVLIQSTPPEQAISTSCRLMRANAPASNEQESEIFSSIAVGLLVAFYKNHPDLADAIVDCVLGTVQSIHSRSGSSKPGSTQIAILLGISAHVFGENDPEAIINFQGRHGGRNGMTPSNVIKLVYQWMDRTDTIDSNYLRDGYINSVLNSDIENKAHLCSLKFLWPSNSSDLESIKDYCAENKYNYSGAN